MPAAISRLMKSRWISALLAALLTTVTATAQERAPVVVELFTSQGCSSCPSADRLLQELADRPDVLALAFHVDYWDHLGWKDTLASRKGTIRQYAYRDSLQGRMVFTPQIVIDGRASVKGTHRAAILASIEEAKAKTPLGFLASPLLIEISLREDGSIHLRLPEKADAPQVPLWLIEYDDRQAVAVARGENAGSTFTYRHPVRGMRRVGQWRGVAEELILPPASVESGRKAAVLAQGERAGPILAAGRVPLAR